MVRSGQETIIHIILHVHDFMIILHQSFADEICGILASQGLKSELVLTRRAQNEKLSVMKFYHSNAFTV